MTMTNHTPGPWRVRVLGRAEDGRPVAYQVDSPSWERLATVSGFEDPTDQAAQQAVHNANLVAAAPDLLYACEHILRNWVGKEGCSFDVAPVISAINRARGVNPPDTNKSQDKRTSLVFMPDRDG